jgi:hypothetical protein
LIFHWFYNKGTKNNQEVFSGVRLIIERFNDWPDLYQKIRIIEIKVQKLEVLFQYQLDVSEKMDLNVLHSYNSIFSLKHQALLTEFYLLQNV